MKKCFHTKSSVNSNIDIIGDIEPNSCLHRKTASYKTTIDSNSNANDESSFQNSFLDLDIPSPHPLPPKEFHAIHDQVRYASQIFIR